MDVASTLRHLGGAARRSELLAAGLRPSSVDTALRRRAAWRPTRGVLAVAEADPVMIAAATYGGPLTCVSALERWGLPIVDRPVGTHLALPPDRHLPPSRTRTQEGIVIHRADAHAVALATPPLRTSPVAIALTHGAECLTPRTLLAAADAAVARALIVPEDFAFGGRVAHIGHWLRREVDGRAGSLLESVARMELTSAGFAVDCQVPIETVGRVDMVVEGSVIVETDGRAYHADEAAFEEDRRRDRAAQALGLRVLRFTATDVVHRPGTVADAVRAVLYPASRLGTVGKG